MQDEKLFPSTGIVRTWVASVEDKQYNHYITGDGWILLEIQYTL